MSGNKLKEKILEYGREGDGKNLEELLQDQAPNDLVALIRKSIRQSDGPALLLYTQQGLQTKQETERTRLDLIKTTLDEIMSTSCLQSTDIKTYVEELANGVRNLSCQSLPDLVDFLQRHVEDLNEREGEDLELAWISLLAPLLENIKDVDLITPKDHHIEISGSEFRQKIILSLCETRWGPRIAIAMAQMFQDARLSSSELDEVFSKMNSVLSKTAVNDLAPFFHQLLKLLKDSGSCSAKLITSITNYFCSKLTLAERQGDNFNSMESSDLIQSEHSSDEIQQTEGIIVYYINQAAKMGHPIAKEMNKLARASVNFPATILNPFSLFACLSLTSVQNLSASILESLKATISKGYSMEENRESSAWFRENTQAIPDIPGLFSIVISQSVRYGGWDLIGKGLVDLGLMLVDTQPPLGKMNAKTRSLHSLAAIILAKVIKKHPSSADIIIPKLRDRIIVNGKNGGQQYTSTLRVIIKEATTYLIEDNNGAAIIDFINNLHRLSYSAGRASLNAMIPLLKLNRSLRNPLILVLRKALFSKNLSTRQVGVSGVYTLLKTFKISSAMSSSQNLSQSSGSLSQLSMDINRGRGVGNESLCAELLGVLKRCFSLQPKVKVIFYEGMNEVVAKNPELCEGLLDLLNNHVLELWGCQGEEGSVTQLDLSKTITEKNGEWVICEPAGWFLHCLQTIVTKGQQVMNGGDSALLDKLAAFLENITTYYSNAELGDLGFDTTDNYDRKTMDGKKRAMKIDVLITMYEAMIDYMMTHQATNVEEKAGCLIKLCHRYVAIKNLVDSANTKQQKKGGGGAKKGEKVKKEDGGGKEDVEEGGKGKDKEKAEGKGTKRTHDGKDKEVEDYKMEMGAFSLKSVAVFLQSLLEDRIPDNQAALNKLREDTSFFGVMESILNILLERSTKILVTTGDEGVHTDGAFKPLLHVTSTLFRHCVTCQEPVDDFLQQSSLILSNYIRFIFDKFPGRKLEIACGLAGANYRQQTPDNLNTLLTQVMESLMRKMINLRNDIERNDEAGPRLTSLAGVYSILVDQLDGSVEHAKSKAADKVGIAVKKFCDDFPNACDDQQLCRTVTKLAFQSSLRLKFCDSLCPRTAQGVHSIYGDLDTSREVEASQNLGYLNTDNADIIVPLMLEHMDACMEYTDQAINWIKSLGGQNAPPNISVNVGEVELAITKNIAKIVTPSQEIVNTALPPGKISEVTLKFLCKLYRILGNLANYFVARVKYNKSSIVSSKMDTLVRMVGTQLSPNVYSLITYVHKKLQEIEEEAKEQRSKKKKVLDPNIARAKKLKETRDIPNLIFQIETFEKNMAKVGKRINQKFDFKLATSRDFRIKLTEDQRKELHESSDESDDEDESDEDSDAGSDNSQEHDSSSVLNQSKNQNNTSVSSLASNAQATKKTKMSAASKLSSKMKENRA